VDFPAEYRAGLMDTHLDDPVRAYRAGQAASAERIKALEEAVAFYADSKNWRSPSSGFAAQYDPSPSPVRADCGIRARNTLSGRNRHEP